MTTSYFQAPELRVNQWIDHDGAPRAPVTLAELGDGYRLLYCFQHWCPGCHSFGFPALQYMHEHLADLGVGFAVIQTVFEGESTNTDERLAQAQQRYELAVPFGHDHIPFEQPTIMQDYRTQGTPWFILIAPDSQVVYSDFRLDPIKAVEYIKRRHDDAEAAL
ncbi:peroxiredoxin family protein [Vibrio parahaemolyticus]|uniref:peroxiredoxin family protein n=1 Tax=Vibrio parahaemolyticus TaxID=670 RepID=UPI003AB0973B